MEESKIFTYVNRVNSVLFLVVLLGGVVLILTVMFQVSPWEKRGSVEVTENSDAEEVNRVELILNGIESIDGQDAQYVQLNSKSSGGKFSSGGYSGRELRNVLFFRGPQLETNWLFETHSFLINDFSQLKAHNDYSSNGPTKVLFVEVIKQDSNGDGKLSEDDLSIIGLAKPDGTRYKEIETNIKSVIDQSINAEGELLILVQVGSEVLLKKYSLNDFNKISEKSISEISKKV